MDANEDVFLARAIPNTFSMIRTNALPMEIEAAVTHNVEHMGDAKGYREASYNTLGYHFSFPTRRAVIARVYLDGASAPHILSCREADRDELLMAATCQSWPEFRQVALTMLALDHAVIEVLGNDGYQAIDIVALGISDADVDEWIRLCTEASLRNKQ